MYAQNPVNQCNNKFRASKPCSQRALPSYGKW